MALQDEAAWIFDPANWSDRKVLHKFNTFGTVELETILRVISKPLVHEDLAVTREILKRNTNISEIYIDKCMIGDGPFKALLEGMKSLKHLKVLSLTANNLSSASVDLIINNLSGSKLSLGFSTFGQSLKLDILDLRNNHLSERDAERLFNNFGHLTSLNGIPIAEIKTNMSITAFHLSKMSLHHSEMIIICLLMKGMANIDEIYISHNYFDVSALKHLVHLLAVKPQVHTLDISYNTLMTGPKNDDLSGIMELQSLLQKKSSLTNVNLAGINVPKAVMKAIELSLKVNKSVYGSKDTGYFKDFVTIALAKQAPPMRANPLENWQPNLDIDKTFCLENQVELCSVECTDKSITLVPIRK